MQAESKFFKKVDDHLSHLPNSWFTNIQQVTINGTPDRLGCVAGKFVALEGKRSPKEKPTPLQKYNIERINIAGGYADVIHPENWAGIHDRLQKLATITDKDLEIQVLKNEIRTLRAIIRLNT